MTQTSINYEQCFEKARAAGQDHIFRWWDELDETGRLKLARQVEKIDFDLLLSLKDTFLGKIPGKYKGPLAPVDFVPLPTTPQQHEERARARKLGEKIIRNGEVALFIVAGGQGSRLRYDPPKGTFPICPITRKSLFQVFAERVRAAEHLYATEIPLYIMTSTTNDGATRQFFTENNFFGLEPGRVRFFTQDMLPTLDTEGKLILAKKDEIAMNPNGHGGSIKALKDSGALHDMTARGARYISYHQVDNVLAHSIDPVFIGYHVSAGAEMSLKVLEKRDAEEKLGVVGRVDSRMRVIEYSDLDDELKYARNEDGSLRYSLGSIAIHMFSVDFIERLTSGGFQMPYHAAEKSCKYIDDDGNLMEPEHKNCIKFEMFVFDVLPEARAAVVMQTDREEEFAPLKNEKGSDSPPTAVGALINRNGRWLRQAGVDIPVDADGNVEGKIEISPLYALDAEQLAAKVDRHLKFTGELLLE